MAITISRARIGLRCPAAGACTVLAIVLLLPPRAGATEWSFSPTLRLREAYSDNINLAPPPQAKSDFVSEIAPAIFIAANGPRLKLDLAYSLQQLIYAHRSDALYHRLSAKANAELLDNWLFFDANSSIGRQNISPFGPQAFDNLHQSGNQSSVQSTRLSPYLHHHFRSLATAELRYAHDSVSSSGNLLDTNSNQVLLSLTGENDGRGWNWDARYTARQTDDAALGSIHSHLGSFSLRYPVASSLGLFATAGQESEGYTVSTATRPQGRFWSVGANWNPSHRSSVSLSAGKRFFGNTYSLNATQRTRNALWSLNYGEGITTTSAEFLRLSRNDAGSLLSELWSASIPNLQQRQLVVNAFLDSAQLLGPERGAINYFSRHYFLQKQLSLSVAAMSAKSTLLLGVAGTRRTIQSSSEIDSTLLPPFQQLSDDSTEQRGVNAAWHWRMSPRTSLNASAAYDRITALDSGRRDNNLALRVGLNRTLRPRVSGSLDVRHARHSSTVNGAGYRENGISATLNFQL